ncbi:MAG: hypothetical protein WBQ73_02980 [Candidatus Babeliales bacterium]
MFPNLKQLFSICIVFLFASLNGNELPLATSSPYENSFYARSLDSAQTFTHNTIIPACIDACSSIKQKALDMNMWYKNLTPEQQKTVLLLTGITTAIIPLYISKTMENNRKEKRRKTEEEWTEKTLHIVRHIDDFFNFMVEKDRKKFKRKVIDNFPAPDGIPMPRSSIDNLFLANLITLQTAQTTVQAALEELKAAEDEVKRRYSASFWEGFCKFFSIWDWIYPLFSKSNDPNLTASSIFENNRSGLEELKNDINKHIAFYNKTVDSSTDIQSDGNNNGNDTSSVVQQQSKTMSSPESKSEQNFNHNNNNPINQVSSFPNIESSSVSSSTDNTYNQDEQIAVLNNTKGLSLHDMLEDKASSLSLDPQLNTVPFHSKKRWSHDDFVTITFHQSSNRLNLLNLYSKDDYFLVALFLQIPLFFSILQTTTLQAGDSSEDKVLNDTDEKLSLSKKFLPKINNELIQEFIALLNTCSIPFVVKKQTDEEFKSYLEKFKQEGTAFVIENGDL